MGEKWGKIYVLQERCQKFHACREGFLPDAILLMPSFVDGIAEYWETRM